MAYDVDVSITVTVKEGPTPMKATIKPAGITDANSKKISFAPNGPIHLFPIKGKDGKIEGRKLLCKKIQIVKEDGASLAFVSIKAPSYVFKQCPANDVSGVAFFLSLGPNDSCLPLEDGKGHVLGPSELNGKEADGCDDMSKATWLKGDYLVLSFCADDTVSSAKWLSIFLDPAMFDCSKDPAKTFDVTLSYGIKGVGEDQAVECCGDNVPKVAQRNANGRVLQMS
jgi:hypothetical protein